jgi:hypothetical protein
MAGRPDLILGSPGGDPTTTLPGVNHRTEGPYENAADQIAHSMGVGGHQSAILRASPCIKPTFARCCATGENERSHDLDGPATIMGSPHIRVYKSGGLAGHDYTWNNSDTQQRGPGGQPTTLCQGSPLL